MSGLLHRRQVPQKKKKERAMVDEGYGLGGGREGRQQGGRETEGRERRRRRAHTALLSVQHSREDDKEARWAGNNKKNAK